MNESTWVGVLIVAWVAWWAWLVFYSPHTPRDKNRKGPDSKGSF